MSWISTDPSQKDPKTGREIDNIKSWSTDQAYTYGHGYNETLAKTGPHTNFDRCSEDLKWTAWKCGHEKHPWAAPGRAPSRWRRRRTSPLALIPRAVPGDTKTPTLVIHSSSRTMFWCPRTLSPGSTCWVGGGTLRAALRSGSPAPTLKLSRSHHLFIQFDCPFSSEVLFSNTINAKP